MGLFKSSPNLPDHEKARVEYHLQQLSECLNSHLFLKPVVVPEEVFGHRAQDLQPQDVLDFVGEYLEYDVHPVTIEVQPKALELCGGGG